MSVNRNVTLYTNRGGGVVAHTTITVMTDSDDVNEIEHRVRQVIDGIQSGPRIDGLFGASVEINKNCELRLDVP